MSDVRIEGAIWRPLPEQQPTIVPRLVVVHSAAAAGSPWSYFNSSSNLESTCWVGLDGRIEQFMGADERADANYLANGFSASIETENHPEFAQRGDWDNDPWTPEQIASIVHVLDWYSTHYPVKRQLANAWDGTGYGYHIQFGTPGKWTAVAKACPGRRRIEQFQQIVVPAACGHYTNGEPVTDADILKIIAGVDAVLKDDRNALDARVNAYVTNATNRAIKEITGKDSPKPNKPVPDWPEHK